MTSSCLGGNISGSRQPFLTETGIVQRWTLSNDGRNVWATVLFLSAIMYMKVRHVNFFLPYLQDHSLLGSRHFATMAT